MAKKETKKKLDVEVKEVKTIKEPIETLIFKPNKPLTPQEYEMLSDMVRSENKKSGVNIVLIPFSCEVGED